MLNDPSGEGPAARAPRAPADADSLSGPPPSKHSRLELLERARALRIADADVMTRAELQAAIERVQTAELRPTPPPTTWLGVARRLLARVVERGLHLPDAAALIRGDVAGRPVPSGPPPVATVTLARIYAAQGHLKRGIATLNEVLASDPDHDPARELRAQLVARLAQQNVAPPPAPSPPEHAVASNGAAPAAHPEVPAELSIDMPAPQSSEPQELAPSESTAPDTTLPELDPALSLFSAPLPSAALTGPEAPITSRPPPDRDVFDIDTKVDHPAIRLRRDSASELAPPAPLPTAPPLPAADAPPPTPAFLALAAPTDTGMEARQTGPRPAALVLVRTAPTATRAAETYLYWELPLPAAAPAAHWVWVVTHTPRGAGSERHENRFPVYRSSGAVRLAGLPERSVVRARLTYADDPDRALAVAGTVGDADDPRVVATRAGDHLANAVPVYC
jgi:hypothetical protein